MKNQFGFSLIIGIAIAAALVIVPGFLLAGYVSNSVTPLNTNLEISQWKADYINALGWCAALTSFFTAIWLLMAHRGNGLDTKSGAWYALGAVVLLGAALISWFVPPQVQQGPGLQVGIAVLLVVLGYWLSALLMTPNQYHHTPLLGKVLWRQRR